MEVDEPRNYDDQRGDVFPAAQPFEDYAKYSHDGEQEEQANGVEANEHIDPEMNGKFDAGTTSTQPNGGPQQSTPPSGQQEAAQEEKSIDPKEILEPYAWDDLEERFLRMMEECQRREEEIEKEFAEWCLVGTLFSPFVPFMMISSFSERRIELLCHDMERKNGFCLGR